MDDFFKNLKVEPIVNIENTNDFEPKTDEPNLKVQNKPEESMIIQQLDEPLLNTIKKIDIVDTDDSGLQKKLNELTDGNKEAIEALRNQPTPLEDSVVIVTSKQDNAVIVTGESKNALLDKVERPPPQAVDVQELNEKLNEITEQSQAAIEELKSQSTKIIDTARAQTNKVLESAKVNFSVYTKALEDELKPKPEFDPPPAQETFEDLIERYSRSGNIMDFFN